MAATKSHESIAGETLPGMKVCVACGADVAGRKRMKDSAGRYWCYDCGVADRKAKAAGGDGAPITSSDARPSMGQCPLCKGVYPEADLLNSDRHGGRKICDRCHNKRKKADKSRRAIADDAADPAKQFALLGGILAAAAVVAAALWTLGYI